MTIARGVWLQDLTWYEAQARFAADAVVVLPIGAAAKAHGAHLPLKTDALTAEALAQRLMDALPVVVAPVVTLGYYPAFAGFAGSQHLSAATFTAVLSELLEGLRRHGVRRIVVLNTGVSTEQPIGALAADADDLLVLHMRGLGASAEALLDAPDGGHADERETSVVLALEPRAVRLDRMLPAGPFEQTAATGDPSRATAFKGERILAARVRDMVQAICRRWPGLAAAS
jgi:creatinine amidohydrolase/Fe(II)-dependent formamide hydrolase-like protein